MMILDGLDVNLETTYGGCTPEVTSHIKTIRTLENVQWSVNLDTAYDLDRLIWGGKISSTPKVCVPICLHFMFNLVLRSV